MIPIPSLAWFLMAATLSNSELMRLLQKHEVTNPDKFYPNYLNFVENLGNMHKRWITPEFSFSSSYHSFAKVGLNNASALSHGNNIYHVYSSHYPSCCSSVYYTYLNIRWPTFTISNFHENTYTYCLNLCMVISQHSIFKMKIKKQLWPNSQVNMEYSDTTCEPRISLVFTFRPMLHAYLSVPWGV